jgi:two-component system OmpR family sensor kinase
MTVSTGNWSIARQLVMLLSIVLGTLWFSGALATLVILNREMAMVLDSGLQETAQRLLPLAVHDMHERGERDKGEDHEGEVLSDEFEEAGEHIVFQVRLGSGQVILRSHDAPVQPFTVDLTPGFRNQDGLRIFTQGSRDGSVFVQVAEQTERRWRAVRNVSVWLIVPFFALIAAAGIAVWWIARQAAKPLIALQRDIGTRGGANLSPVATKGLPSELTPITGAVNRLLAHLSQVLAAERAFASNSAHELRTPVAAALAQAQLLQSQLAGKPEGERAAKLVQVLGRLSRLVEKLLQLARAEAGVGLTGGESDLAEAAKLIVDEHRDRSNKRPEKILMAVHPPVSKARIDPDALGIALQNLVANALLHGSGSRPVNVLVGPGATIVVTNAGAVIPADRLAHLTERFSRGDTGALGEGLGLAIVDTIMRQCGGRLELFSPVRGQADGFEAVLSFNEAKTSGSA